MLELTSTDLLHGELVPFYIDPASAVAEARIADLPLPASAVLSLILRGSELVPPKGDTKLLPGDHVYVFCKPEDLPLVQLLCGQQMQE
jgi:cell volume regulation protein A